LSRAAARATFAAAAGLVALTALVLATRARAATEEFSTFSVVSLEQDDDSYLDHLLTRTPLAWQQEWAHATQGIRSSQGCLNSGLWFEENDLKVRAPLGSRAWLGVALRESQSDVVNYSFLDFTFHFPVRVGTVTAMFRPSPEKAAQDFALGWEVGADTSALQLQAVFTLEDVFNNFWAFRQTQVGGASEPYEKRPFEPALRFATRHDRWRAEISGQWLTASRKRIQDLDGVAPQLHRELWGVLARGQVEADVGPVTLEARTDHRQARGHDVPIATGVVEQLDFRRLASAEGAARTTLAGRTTVEFRYLYQWRAERVASPQSPASLLHDDDRMENLDVLHRVLPALTVRAGLLNDRIGVAAQNLDAFTWGTRTSTRFYFGPIARFGRVNVQGTECLALRRKPYPTWFRHNHGFLQLQTTF
jgi:hypothetical protein